MAGGRKILLVDDDPVLRHSLAEQLRLNEEFVPTEAGTAADALALVGRGDFDALLLDVGLPDMDGRELCRQLRRSGVSSPILMLTDAGCGADAAAGLDCGADGHIAKPFRVSVLLARLRAELRRRALTDEAGFTIGRYVFRPGTKLLLDGSGQKKVRLTEKETAILTYLCRAVDRTVGRDTLLNEVWGYNSGVTTHTLETHIYRLRQKIERDAGAPELLMTEPGGYRLAP